MPIQDFTKSNMSEIIEYIKTIISYTEENNIFYSTIMILGSGKRASTRKDKLIKYLKNHKYRVYEKTDEEGGIIIKCRIGEI